MKLPNPEYNLSRMYNFLELLDLPRYVQLIDELRKLETYSWNEIALGTKKTLSDLETHGP